MAKFTYEASDKTGFIIKGEIEAMDKNAVIEHLRQRELIAIAVHEAGARTSRLSFNLFDKIAPLDKILLMRNLSASVKAGLNIVESLDILIADVSKKSLHDMLVQAKENLQNGQPLSHTFAAYSDVFPPVVVGMLRAGEASGNLDEVLEELSEHLSKEYSLARRIRATLAYPILLLAGSAGVVTLLLVFLLPRLEKAFLASKVELPLITRIFLTLSNILTYSPLIDVAVIVVTLWVFLKFRKTSGGRRFFLNVGLKIPVVRDLIKKIALVRLTRTLGSLVRSAIPIVEALNLSASSAGNEHYRQAILESVEEVKGGVPFSRTLEQRPNLFPRFLTSLVAVGERTGTLEHVLKTSAAFYDEDVDSALKNLSTFLEPILLLFMGFVVGSIAISVLWPIYQLVGTFT